MQHRSLRSLRSHGLRHSRYFTSAFASTSLCRSLRSLLLAHSLCSYARPHALGGHAVYVVSLTLHYPHAPSGRTRIRSHGLCHARLMPTLPSGRTGSLSGVALLRIKNTRIYCIKVIKL